MNARQKADSRQKTDNRDTDITDIVDDARARELADAYNMPLIELDAALFGETLETAHVVLDWIDREERVLTARHGPLQGRRRYRPVKMLRNWAAKNGTGRRKTTTTAETRNPRDLQKP